ncbi:MAG TPA: AIR synthase family protein [bacterium]|nr:AIR synthase family protein [bacterium]
MKTGKVSPDVLRRLIFPYLGRRADVLVHAGVGQDAAVLDFGEWAAVLTCDPITGTQEHLGRLAVHVTCNDLATTGAEPVALLLTLLLHADAGPQTLSTIMRDAGEAAAALGVEIIGGHTEVTPGIDRTIAMVAGVGRVRKEDLITSRGARPGDTVLLTKGVAVEGTAILAADLVSVLRGRVDDAVLAAGRRLIERISVVPEGMIAARYGATAMHDVTEGGILAGAWELAEAAGIGIEIRGDAVPVLPETAAVCRALGADPLALIGSGAMLIATRTPQRTAEALEGNGIPAAEIGVMTAAGRTLRAKSGVRELVPPERDELWRILEETGTLNVVE